MCTKNTQGSQKNLGVIYSFSRKEYAANAKGFVAKAGNNFRYNNNVTCTTFNSYVLEFLTTMCTKNT